MRRTAPDGPVYRLTVETLAEDGTVASVAHFGPWAKLGTARGQRTALQGEDRRRVRSWEEFGRDVYKRPRPRERRFRVEESSTVWTEVAE